MSSSRDLHEQELRQVERLLKQLGYDRIPERMKVVEAFFTSEGHHSIPEWHELLRRKGLNVEPVFVAEVLELLVRLGLATRRQFEDQPTRYEHRHLGEHHDHLICTRCGCISEFHDPALEELKAQVARSHGFYPLSHKLQIYGLCPRCRATRQPTMALSMASPGEKLVLSHIAGGRQMRAQLKEMGLTEGVELEVLSDCGGPVVVAVGGTRLALGRGVAAKIMVRPAESSRSSQPEAPQSSGDEQAKSG